MTDEPTVVEPSPHYVRDDRGELPADLPPLGQRKPEHFWWNRFHVDLATKEVRHERIRCEDLEDVLGGCARGFKLLQGHGVDDPYVSNARLIMNLGILSGTEFMTGLRTFFHAYSPLKNSLHGKPSAMWTAGSGKFGTKLRYLGVDEVLFTGRSVEPVYLHLSASDSDELAGVSFDFKDAKDLLGKTVNDKTQELHGRHPAAHFAVLGPAGENYFACRFAAIALSTENQFKSGDMKSRFCGRGGIGGVMGSKNLIAIAADTKDIRGPKGPENLRDLNKMVARGEGSRRFREKKKDDGGGGTWANVAGLHPVNAMPEMNFNPTGNKALSKPLYRDAVEEGPFVVKDEACYRCGIRCHKNVYDENEEGKAGKFRAKLDYEPLNLLSANIGIFDIDQCCELVELGDQLGMDSISLGSTISYAMEYNRRNASSGKSVANGLAYGDYDASLKAIRDIGEGRLEELGRGSKRLSEAVGQPEYAMHCKGMEFPAYLPQTNPGYPWALAGGHMSMRTYLLLLVERETDMDYWIEAITGRGPLIMRDDVIGICKFAGMKDEHMVEAISSMTGLELDEETLRQTVMRTYLRGYRLEKDQGFTMNDYVMPKEVHNDYPAIELPSFVTEKFFEELREKVCAKFDAMLEDSGI